MQASEAGLEARFERVGTQFERGRRLPVVGQLIVPATGGRADDEGAVDATPTTFAFEVRGNGMLEEGIREGDRLLIQRREDIPSSATVLVEIDGRFTVRRFHREGDGRIRLQPANPDLLPLVLRGDRLRVCGVVVGLLRRSGFTAPSVSRGPRATPPSPRQGHIANDLTYRILKANLGEWRRLTTTSRSPRNRVASARIRSLGRSLHALVATYTTIANERLRHALLEEAGRISREMRFVAAGSGWPAARIRPLPSNFAPRTPREANKEVL